MGEDGQSLAGLFHPTQTTTHLIPMNTMMRSFFRITCLLFCPFSFLIGSLSDLFIPIELTEPSSGLEPVDCIYLINLKERQERYHIMQELLQKEGLKANRVEGVNGWLLSESQKNNIPIAPESLQLRGGQLGCFLSHISVWKDAFERGFDCIWIMEDDITFDNPSSQLPSVLEELNAIDPGWDVLYTDHIPQTFGVYPHHRHRLSRTEPITQYIPVSKNLVRIYARWCTYSMLLSRSGIEKVLRYISETPFFGPIDYQIHFVPDLREYCLTKSIGSPSPLYYQTSDTMTAPPSL